VAVAVIAGVGDPAGDDLEGRKKGGGAVAFVVVGGALGKAGTQRQDRCGAIQRLDLGFLVDAQHDRALRWVQIKPDDVTDFRLKQRVGGELGRAPTPWLKAVATPGPCDRRVPDPQLLGQKA
jgi:hypothetical protein